MLEPMQFLPMDLQGVRAGGFNRPEGWYLLTVKSVEFFTPEGGGYSITRYITEIHMGPGTSQQFHGKTFKDGIFNREDFKPMHMEMLAACMGSEAAVHEVAAQYGGKYPPAMCLGRTYMAMIRTNKKGFDNVQKRIPYTPEAWAEHVTSQEAASPNLITPTYVPAAAAPPPVMAAPAPVAPPPAFQAPPAMAAPPQMQAAPTFAPQAAPTFAPAPAFAPPQMAAPQAPPPPPGLPTLPGR